ncbi:hypothetical protein KUTG_00733 [Kutzneria sp. 744]|nr:hypothetical protein KUTG_00733 [Kutzneria sp. 744]
MHFRDLGDALEWRAHGETLRIEPWGPDAVRVRVAYGGPLVDDLPGALLAAPPHGGKAEISVNEHYAAGQRRLITSGGVCKIALVSILLGVRNVRCDPRVQATQPKQ